jgi:FkbM family methyltransferase
MRPMLEKIAQTVEFILRHPIGKRRPVRSLGRYAWWQLQSRLRKELTVSWIGSTQLAVRRGMTGATGNIYCGLHEFPEMAFTLHLLREGDLFCDVGANVGSYSVLASGVRQATTIAIEAAPETAQYLRRNVALNEAENLVEIHEVLVGRSVGTAGFTSGNGPCNHVIEASRTDARILPMSTLDVILGDRCPVLIKMDVESYEEEVFAGSRATLADPRLKAISTESVGNFKAQLLDHGFEVVYYDPSTRSLSSTPNGIHHSNILLVRNREWVAARLRDAPSVQVLGFAY